MSLETTLKFHLRRLPFLKKVLKKILRIETVNGQFAELERKLIYQYISQLNQRILTLEDRNGIAGKKILDFGDTRVPVFSKVTSQAATMSQMLEPEYEKWCHRIHDQPNFHRKHWEYAFILKALEQEGKLVHGSRGLGFGVGKDPIVAYMVKQGCNVIATDLDSSQAIEKGWAQTNQYAEKLLNLNERRICSDRDLKKQVSLQSADMNQIPKEFTQGTFDFVWSACAFEHLGSIEKGLQFVMNSIDCLKSGGVAVHTTELNLSSNDLTIDTGGTVLFRKQDFEDLAERCRKKGYSIDLNFHVGTQPLDQYYDVPPYSESNHLKLLLENFITTSYGVIIRKN